MHLLWLEATCSRHSAVVGWLVNLQKKHIYWTRCIGLHCIALHIVIALLLTNILLSIYLSLWRFHFQLKYLRWEIIGVEGSSLIHCCRDLINYLLIWPPPPRIVCLSICPNNVTERRRRNTLETLGQHPMRLKTRSCWDALPAPSADGWIVFCHSTVTEWLAGLLACRMHRFAKESQKLWPVVVIKLKWMYPPEQEQQQQPKLWMAIETNSV